MATHDDNNTVVRIRSESTLLAKTGKASARQPEPEMAEGTGMEPEAGEKREALPLPGSAYDAAYARPNNRPLPTLHLVIGDAVKGLPYSNLDSIDLLPGDKPGVGPAIVILFTGIIPRKAKITGRHLGLLHDLISDHRIKWVRELPKGRDFKDKDDKATVITGITIEPVKEPA
jgi:hypothetical protein